MSYPPPPAFHASSPAPMQEPPLNRPYYGAPFPISIKRFFAKYADFSGRASRAEYWWWFLAAGVVGILYSILNAVLRSPTASPTEMYFTSPGQSVVQVIYFLFVLAVFVPGLALAWRRLHDTNRSGGWYFINLIPLVGPIVFLVWTASVGNFGGQRFDR